jgi:hypothetical protein
MENCDLKDLEVLQDTTLHRLASSAALYLQFPTYRTTLHPLILIGTINPLHSNRSVNATNYETGKNESDSNIPPPLRSMLPEKFHRKPTDPTRIARATARQTAPDQIYEGTRVPVPPEMRRRGKPWGARTSERT